MKLLITILSFSLLVFIGGGQQQDSEDLVVDVYLSSSKAKVVEKIDTTSLTVEIITTSNDNLEEGDVVKVVFSQPDSITSETLYKVKSGDLVQVDYVSSDIHFEQTPSLIYGTRLTYSIPE